GVELRGGGVGHPSLGLIPGQLQVAGRRAVLAGLREVERQRFGRRARLVLQRLADAAVQPPPPRGRQAALPPLPDQVAGGPAPPPGPRLGPAPAPPPPPPPPPARALTPAGARGPAARGPPPAPPPGPPPAAPWRDRAARPPAGR